MSNVLKRLPTISQVDAELRRLNRERMLLRKLLDALRRRESLERIGDKQPKEVARG